MRAEANATIVETVNLFEAEAITIPIAIHYAAARCAQVNR
jgi:hypothetical protein